MITPLEKLTAVLRNLGYTNCEEQAASLLADRHPCLSVEEHLEATIASVRRPTRGNIARHLQDISDRKTDPPNRAKYDKSLAEAQLMEQRYTRKELDLHHRAKLAGATVTDHSDPQQMWRWENYLRQIGADPTTRPIIDQKCEKDKDGVWRPV